MNKNVITKLLVATHNPGKVAEFASLFGDVGIEWVSLTDAGITTEVAEEGHTLLQNAKLKAEGYASLSGLLTLADDTGLEIEALGGQPGIYPARYGGAELTPVERYELVLGQMRGVPVERRGACFRCVVAIAGQGGLLAYAEGTFPGQIALEPAGAFGFGYDPIFYLPAYGKTLAQLDPEIKRRISHRGQAVSKILPELMRLLAEGTRS